MSLRFVSYRRVSTEDQGVSGLGLEAQQSTIDAYVKAQGGVYVGEFVEVASGSDDERPELAKARDAASKHKAILICAKLDRLSRDLAYIATFLKGVKGKAPEFVACDNPHANKTTLQMTGLFAEFERERISVRTREALAALKARGVKLGGTNLEGARASSLAKRQATANDGKAKVMRSIESIQSAGITTLKGIAAELNARGIATPRGGEWSATQVSRVLN
jgi:DNA invertase Pin-like site-specific DNA recombinase